MMIAILAIAVTAALLFCWFKLVAHFWSLFADTGAHQREIRPTVWLVKGVMIPVAVWVVFNFTLAPGRVAAMDQVAIRKLAGDEWAIVLGLLTLPALLLIASFWAATTLTWLVIHLAARTESRREIRGAGIFWGGLLLPVAALIVYCFGWYASAVGVVIVLLPIIRDLTALGTPRKLAPGYGGAIERIKRGHYAAAELEVIRQLERREEDFEGWMLLASLYANCFGDLAEAERTVREVCRQTSTTQAEYCNALSQLAEWHWKLGNDSEAARKTWEEICTTYPHSEFADAARRRLNHLARLTAGSSNL